ncbi:hypothetical protein DB88DRAFT_502893 [Papiliotrema laurentii]|uniref:Uncharacterized protein n=1 Tax=Papiliotrema laurentii TaxID=5418 RepID=A0AAD9CU96_PAPLA|nr:hypothetical protein DB88DRAFT_502893 [Papiliotrema laurentii]
MCRQLVCEECHKKTWTGCGQHIETRALKDVPVEERCPAWEKGGSGTCKDATKAVLGQ